MSEIVPPRFRDLRIRLQERKAYGCGTTVEAEAMATPTGLRMRRRSWIWGVTSPAAPREIGSLAGKLAVCPCVGCGEK